MTFDFYHVARKLSTSGDNFCIQARNAAIVARRKEG